MARHSYTETNHKLFSKCLFDCNLCVFDHSCFLFLYSYLMPFFYAGSQPGRYGGGNSYNGTHQSTPGIKGSVRSVRTSQNTFVRDTALLKRCEIFYCFVGNGGDELEV